MLREARAAKTQIVFRPALLPKRQSELIRFDAFRGKIEKDRLEQYPLDFRVFFELQQVEGGLHGLVTVNVLQRASDGLADRVQDDKLASGEIERFLDGFDRIRIITSPGLRSHVL